VPWGANVDTFELKKYHRARPVAQMMRELLCRRTGVWAIERPLVVARQTTAGVSGVHAPVVATVTTVFRDHSEFTVAVPTEMREEYRLPDWAGLQVTGVATYTQFRRFGVQVDEQVTLPK
jgi:hypothetical protein